MLLRLIANNLDQPEDSELQYQMRNYVAIYGIHDLRNAEMETVP